MASQASGGGAAAPGTERRKPPSELSFETVCKVRGGILHTIGCSSAPAAAEPGCHRCRWRRARRPVFPPPHRPPAVQLFDSLKKARGNVGKGWSNRKW